MSTLSLLPFFLHLISLVAVTCTATASPAIIYSTDLAVAPCATTTIVPAQIQSGPTFTTYTSTVTSKSSVACGGCALVLKTFVPVTDVVPFRTTVTADVTTTTSYGCLAGETSGTHRHHHLPTPFPSGPVSNIYGRDLLKRATDLPPFGGEAEQLVIKLATAIYIVEVINNGGDLTKACDNVNVAALYLEGLDGHLAKQRICAAALSPPPTADPSSRAQIIALATALYAVEVAGNYAGGTDLTNLCNVIDLNTIVALGFDGSSVKQFVCSAASNTPSVPACTVPSTGSATADPVNTSKGFTTVGTGVRPTHGPFTNPGQPISGSGDITGGPLQTTLRSSRIVTINSTISSQITYSGTVTADPVAGTATASSSKVGQFYPYVPCWREGTC